jgi:two-component system nitrogen regulation response regulator GlnG
MPAFTEGALLEMQRRPWHGNVRELRNAVEHAVIVARGGVIDAEHLPPPAPPAWLSPARTDRPAAESIAELVRSWTEARLAQPGNSTQLYDELLRLVEPPFLQTILEKYHGQCAGAARVLGLHRTTLRKKLDQYGLSEE